MVLPNRYNPVVYLSSEFAIDNDLPTYAGGLGVLAGDYMNAAALVHRPTVGIGILYKGKSFIQHVTAEGKEEKRDSEFDHDTSFLRPTTIKGRALTFTLPTHGNPTVKAYHVRLSDESILFFLSTDVDQNPPDWVADMDTLYSGDIDSQLRQEILLGVGGVMLMEELHIKPRLLHFNEGRPVFAIWEYTRMLMNSKQLSFDQAWEEARKNIVYTNHTLVAAGNPLYPMDKVKYWAEPFATQLHIPVERLVESGKKDDFFSITDFALNVSSKHSAVSKVHGEYSKKQYPSFDWVTITNGVHMPRWQDSDYRNPTLCDESMWEQHLIKKQELVRSVIKRTGFGYDEKRLVITWARRLAEYKQPKAIFTDIERLKRIVSNEQFPVQILYAGNSHAADPNSKNLIEEIISIFSTELNGHAIFVPNYNISLANHLTSGSDIWLNTPKGNLEACGTSGMKAISNGVLNCTVRDGWTYEVDWDGIGWILDPNNAAENFYDLLEKEIIPLYYARDENGLPIEWIHRMRASIDIAKRFSAERMLEEYEEKLYRQQSI
ncbi:hypothetical protein A2801_03040 [Candidatus Woesebacteria bacterium RIFCSPHIGHO2_01_FULL_41_10]|uniref:Glycogen phosphorylase n=1 Tax=Candidatus Woesebacteria bacterium RIFCSPHIGHO2_01_FULL_41_10 TaxID=1802500 RepID=A0A1F7YPS6_9BACT|nr:MAG: hypothetical protein A2801_03040 [Candidatus Woesebacteria bacterium RIFCSPHIGHO2_01_FULL_41_10]